MLLSVFFVVLCAVIISDGHLIPRHYVFLPEAGVWVKFHFNPLKWEEAVLECHSEGGILASPLNANFSKAITSAMCRSPVFTGISNIYSKNEYQSVEGVPLSNICLAWLESVEPDVDDKETNCIALDWNSFATVVPCSKRLPFVCFRKERSKLNQCSIANSDYVLDKRTGSCYKGYADYILWTEAYERCTMDGAHLAVINSPIEARVIYELAKTLVSIKPKNESSLYVSLGFRAWDYYSECKTWLTIQGQSLYETGYDKWAPTEPNNKGGREFCGSLYAGDNGKFEDGTLNDVHCDLSEDRYRFICEIEPKKDASTN